MGGGVAFSLPSCRRLYGLNAVFETFFPQSIGKVSSKDCVFRNAFKERASVDTTRRKPPPPRKRKVNPPPNTSSSSSTPPRVVGSIVLLLLRIVRTLDLSDRSSSPVRSCARYLGRNLPREPFGRGKRSREVAETDEMVTYSRAKSKTRRKNAGAGTSQKRRETTEMCKHPNVVQVRKR